MPQNNTWKPRIPEILKELQERTDLYLTRVEIEKMLGITRSHADRIMGAVGCVSAGELGRPGKLNYSPVAAFSVFLNAKYDDAARREHDRLERLDRKLNEAKEERVLRDKRVVHWRDEKQVAKVLRGRLEDIPGCNLTTPENGRPGVFTLTYVNTVDLLGKFMLFGLAAIHHEEHFNQVTTPIERKETA